MSALEALIIGILQGLTEFLPVSSSAHLKLMKLFLGISAGENLVIFDLVCHLGTLVAILLFLRREILEILTDRKKLGLIVTATLPLVPFYFFLKPLRDWASDTHLLGFCLILTSLILFAGSRLRLRSVSPELPTFKRQIQDALWIGTLQSTALIPGISRSASTISGAQILGWEAKDAVRFSFLLSIPTVIGGNCIELLKLQLASSYPLTLPFSTYLFGFLSSCTVGLVVIRFAMRFLEKGNLKPFAWYCLILGIISSIYLNW